jgi:hypothetical protein
MRPLTVIEDFDVLSDCESHPGSGGEPMSIVHFVLKGRGGGIAPTHANPPDAGSHAAGDAPARSRLYFRLIRVRSRASASYREAVPAQVADGADRRRALHRSPVGRTEVVISGVSDALYFRSWRLFDAGVAAECQEVETAFSGGHDRCGRREEAVKAVDDAQ